MKTETSFNKKESFSTFKKSMKTETSFNKKESFSILKKSNVICIPVKKKLTITSLNRFVKNLKSNQNKNSEKSSLTDEMLKFRANSFSSKKVSSNETINLCKELEDPNNLKIKTEIQKLLDITCDLTLLEDNYENLAKHKSDDSHMITDANLNKIEPKYKYIYSRYLLGLKPTVDSFFDKREEEFKSQNMKSLNKRTSENLILTTITSIKKQDISSLENIYNLLGHEVYTKLIKVYEKYCFFGKSNSNFNMDYSQFTSFINENNFHNQIITKLQSEMIFNKSKSGSKSINFEEFINVLSEFSKLIFYWEKKPFNSLRYFIYKFILNIQCLNKTEEDILLDKWYFLFQFGDLSKDVKKHLEFLYKTFQLFKVKDLRMGECMDVQNFIIFAKENEIIPIFLSAKESINIINFVRYKKKSLIPNIYFDFCSFVEIISLIAIQSYEKFNFENKESTSLDARERIKIFLKYLRDK